ncbi:hypothetical protein [Pseudoalteromonas rubra]|uniref:hypothetical protein n=1 Tax=Pseudoalteromonas rubra TaxID=43658 RepID=UPI002DBB8ED2|nr:hypothetical protein [Pseudoalteromonas rubra]MEC4090126.1 hypothetical protein [Pseudoalteromonas rubra]
MKTSSNQTIKLKKKNLKTLSSSSLNSVYGGLTTTGEEPERAKMRKIELTGLANISN